MTLAARTILVTGASRGIGRLVAAELAAAGARLVLVARDAERVEQAVRELPGEGHRAAAADVTDAEALRIAVGAESRLDGVVAAAGVIGPIGPLGSWTAEEFRAAFEVNVLGVLQTVLACRDRLATGTSIVTFSGGGATAPMRRFDAYAASKAALVRLTENLAADLAGAGIRCNSIAPGFIPTAIQDEVLAAGPELAGEAYHERTRRGVEEGEHDPPELPGRLAAFLLSDAAEGITGKLLSARWDPWEDPAFQERLRREPDLATLRRIDDQFFTQAPR